jgi:hypothetical protein
MSSSTCSPALRRRTVQTPERSHPGDQPARKLRLATGRELSCAAVQGALGRPSYRRAVRRTRFPGRHSHLRLGGAAQREPELGDRDRPAAWLTLTADRQ